MTEDPDVLVPHLDGLTPDVMPQEGTRAAKALALDPIGSDTKSWLCPTLPLASGLRLSLPR